MSPTLALFLWIILVLALLRFDPAKEPDTSLALWVPVIWIFIIGSRLPAQWFGVQQLRRTAEAFEEGNSLDRNFFVLLILLAIGILVSRSFDWRDFFGRNVALVAFLSFALLSVMWSDFPFVTFKRWFRDLGNYLVILVVLSDPRPLAAANTVLRRLCFLLIPLSVLLIKYYPHIAIGYDAWTGRPYYAGATMSKNGLGVLCLVSGLFIFWDTLARWSERKERPTKRIILVNVVLLSMTLWLLTLADSATARVCLVLGCVVIAAAHTRTVKHNPALLQVMVPVGICLYLLLEMGFGIDIRAMLAEAVGRNPSLTGRTYIWDLLLSMDTNPLVGTGYESFWLGPRLQWVWQNSVVGRINQAHNGYLELYLNLGVIGLFLLGGFLIASYRIIWRRFAASSHLASLMLALWTVLLFYNVTEAAFKAHLMWSVFLLGAIAVPTSTERSTAAEVLSEEPPSKLWERAAT